VTTTLGGPATRCHGSVRANPARRYHVSWARDRRGVSAGDRGFELGLAGMGGGERLFDLATAGQQRGFVGDLRLQRRAQPQEVVRVQPKLGVPQVGLDGRGTASDLGLLAERLELAAQLAGEVLA